MFYVVGAARRAQPWCRHWISVMSVHRSSLSLSPHTWDRITRSQSGSLPSVDQLSLQNDKVRLGKLERILPSINFRVSFLWIHPKETYESMDLTSIPAKLSAGNSFNKMGKLDHQLFETWGSCGFFNKRDLWKTMHRQTKCWQLSWLKDSNHPQNNNSFVTQENSNS